MISKEFAMSAYNISHVASDRFESDNDRTKFVQFMLTRFKSGYTTYRYAQEWATRIIEQRWDAADNETRSVLHDIYGVVLQ